MTEVINELKDAQVGDLVWLYDDNANRYDENKKYLGRGDWRKTQITEKTRLSLVSYQTKFTLEGRAREKNGFAPGVSIYGQKEKEAKEWLDKNAYFLAQKIQYMGDAEMLKKVAELVGYEEKP